MSKFDRGLPIVVTQEICAAINRPPANRSLVPNQSMPAVSLYFDRSQVAADHWPFETKLANAVGALSVLIAANPPLLPSIEMPQSKAPPATIRLMPMIPVPAAPHSPVSQEGHNGTH